MLVGNFNRKVKQNSDKGCCMERNEFYLLIKVICKNQHWYAKQFFMTSFPYLSEMNLYHYQKINSENLF